MISYRPLPTPADLAHAWHGDRTDPRTLLGDCRQGEHCLCRGGRPSESGALRRRRQPKQPPLRRHSGRLVSAPAAPGDRRTGAAGRQASPIPAREGGPAREG